MKNRREVLKGILAATLGESVLRGAAAQKPNIVLIYTDDLGYGDLGSYGAKVVKTPNLDKLAAQSLRFTDAHCSSAVCTPSRYALLTGEYPWRKSGTGVLPGDAALIIEPGRTTLPSMLKRAGYATGCVGKWHLGLGNGELDWNRDIKPGPNELGFDYSFIVPATGDRTPCVYMENHRVVGLDPNDPIQVSFKAPVGSEPTAAEHPELSKWPSKVHNGTVINGIGRIGYMTGGAAARWNDEEMAAHLTRKAVSFIEQHQAERFFLYFATDEIHVPRVPGRKFAGKSACGLRCDAIEELDWTVGEIMAALDRLHLTNDTLLLFSSDNGPVVEDAYQDGSAAKLNGHKPAGPFRGGKGTTWEGATRVPFLARWPGHIQPGVSDALFGQIDLLATLANLTGEKLTKPAGPDSMNLLPTLLGKSSKGRDWLVEHFHGRLALRKGPWKLIVSYSGTPGHEREVAGTVKGPGELYRLADDIGETRNVAAENPKVAQDMLAFLEKVRRWRSTS